MYARPHALAARSTRLTVALGAAIFVSACTSVSGGRCCPPPRCGEPSVEPHTASSDLAPATKDSPTPARAAPPKADGDPAQGAETPVEGHALYDGATGQRTEMARMLDDAKGASLFAVGELHGNLVGADVELRVLRGLAEQGAPMALAMEFLERDTQESVDAYLAGQISEARFVKEARLNAAYAKTHRPLIEYCKTHKLPVIAANAPRRLVTAYRKSAKSYAEYLQGLSERDRGYLPATTTIIEDRHQERFLSFMGGDRGARLFKSMSLWDDAMAESVASFQDAHPEHRVVLVVGVFHVTERLGTITKYLQRRPDASVRVLAMSMSKDPSLSFTQTGKGAGDFVLKVPAPSKKLPATVAP